jgi:hypothetical protein
VRFWLCNEINYDLWLSTFIIVHCIRSHQRTKSPASRVRTPYHSQSVAENVRSSNYRLQARLQGTTYPFPFSPKAIVALLSQRYQICHHSTSEQVVIPSVQQAVRTGPCAAHSSQVRAITRVHIHFSLRHVPSNEAWQFKCKYREHNTCVIQLQAAFKLL